MGLKIVCFLFFVILRSSSSENIFSIMKQQANEITCKLHKANIKIFPDQKNVGPDPCAYLQNENPKGFDGTTNGIGGSNWDPLKIDWGNGNNNGLGFNPVGNFGKDNNDFGLNPHGSLGINKNNNGLGYTPDVNRDPQDFYGTKHTNSSNSGKPTDTNLFPGHQSLNPNNQVLKPGYGQNFPNNQNLPNGQTGQNNFGMGQNYPNMGQPNLNIFGFPNNQNSFPNNGQPNVFNFGIPNQNNGNNFPLNKIPNSYYGRPNVNNFGIPNCHNIGPNPGSNNGQFYPNNQYNPYFNNGQFNPNPGSNYAPHGQYNPNNNVLPNTYNNIPYGYPNQGIANNQYNPNNGQQYPNNFGQNFPSNQNGGNHGTYSNNQNNPNIGQQFPLNGQNDSHPQNGGNQGTSFNGQDSSDHAQPNQGQDTYPNRQGNQNPYYGQPNPNLNNNQPNQSNYGQGNQNPGIGQGSASQNTNFGQPNNSQSNQSNYQNPNFGQGGSNLNNSQQTQGERGQQPNSVTSPNNNGSVYPDANKSNKTNGQGSIVFPDNELGVNYFNALGERRILKNQTGVINTHSRFDNNTDDVTKGYQEIKSTTESHAFKRKKINDDYSEETEDSKYSSEEETSLEKTTPANSNKTEVPVNGGKRILSNIKSNCQTGWIADKQGVCREQY